MSRLRPTFPAKPALGTVFNSSHPLATNMLLCLLFNEGGGSNGVNLVTGKQSGYVKNGSIPPADINAGAYGRYGLGIKNNNAGSYEFQSYVDAGDLTLHTGTLSFGVITTYSGDRFTQTHCVNKSDTGSNYVWRVVNSGDTNLVGGITGSSSATLSIDTNGLVGPQFVMYTYDGTTFKAYLNGHLYTSSTPGIGAIVEQSTYTVKVGGFQGNGNTNWQTPIYAVYLWDRALGASEIAELAREPYNLFAVPSRRIVGLVSAGGGGGVGQFRVHPGMQGGMRPQMFGGLNG